MTLRSTIAKIVQHEDLNFLLTNRIPRQLLTRFIGWFSKIEQPLIRDASIAVWKLFSDLDLNEAKKNCFTSMHDCFTRELRAGARPINYDTKLLISPCDAIIGATGQIQGIELLQAKGFPYTLLDILGDAKLVEHYHDGTYVTLRLTSSMYHRFHAPYACRVEQVNYISGDTWNVNQIALKRVEKLFCKNERAVIQCQLQPSGHLITLVPVAAVLVASIRLHCLDVLLHLKYSGSNQILCDAYFETGQEMGWFQHGSTIIVFAPAGFSLCEGIADGQHIRMGQPLMRLPVFFNA
ncbi:MAG: archaetidylserine decarboxylase [Steroidobacteraceae bacterium]